MNKEEIEELKDFTIDLTNIDELALGLEVCSKKSNMVIQEFANLIIELEQQCKKQKEVIDKVMNLIKKYGKYDGEKCTQGFQMWSADFNKILDILKEVSE